MNNSIKIIKNVFINSKNRENSNDKSYDFTLYFPPGSIMCSNNEILKINIINFHCPNSMYNINASNNKIHILIKNNDILEDEFILTIEIGNYNVYELMDTINNLCSDYMNIQYVKIRNTFKFFKNESLMSDVYIKVSEGKFFGIEDDTEYLLNFESIYPINLVAYNKLVINCPELQYFGGSLENLDEKGFEISNIFFWCSRQDIANMAEIQYNNEDGGNSFNYTLQNKTIDSLRFVVTNENYRPITDLPDWTMIIQLYSENIDEDDRVFTVLSNILEYFKGIYAMFYIVLNKLKII